MKKKTITLVTGLLTMSAVLFTSCDSSSANQSNTFKVYGNCGMCEKTIEGSLKDVEGVFKADWDKNTKLIVVDFDSTKIKLDEIKSKIVGVGYDMEGLKSNDEVYSELPMCCQYKREGDSSDEEMNEHMNDQMDGQMDDHMNHNDDENMGETMDMDEGEVEEMNTDH